MRFLLLVTTVIVACSATSLYRGKNVIFNEDGTLEISTPFGKRILIDRNMRGPKNLDIEIGGPWMMTKRIKIGDRRIVGSGEEEETGDQFKFGPKMRKSQNDVLIEIFKDFEGNLDEMQFNQLLQRLDEAVRRGELNPRVRDLLEKIEKDRLIEEVEEEEDEEKLLRKLPQQQMLLVQIINQLRRLQQIQLQRPTTNINEQIRRQQQFTNIMNLLQQQVQLKQLKLNRECGLIGGGLTLTEQQQIFVLLNLLRQQQQLLFQQVQIIPGLTPWKQQQQITNCIKGLEQLLELQQQCQQMGGQMTESKFGGLTTSLQQRRIQELLEQQQQQQGRQILGLTPWQRQQQLEKEGRFRQIGGLLPWQQQTRRIPQMLEQEEEPLMMGMTSNVEPFQGFIDTDGLTEVVGGRVGDEVIYHTLPMKTRRPNLIDLMTRQQLRQRETLDTPQTISEFPFY